MPARFTPLAWAELLLRVSHAGCGPSLVAEAELPGPGEARLAERWAAFLLPRVPLVALQAVAGVWTGEREPALFSMLRGLGFESAREALDSDLFATGVGSAPRASGLALAVDGADLELDAVAKGHRWRISAP